MNKEFKKIKSKKETRYVLEAASVGATSSAAVATGPVGKKGNLLVQGKDDQPVVQRRNPVAANVNAAIGGGGSGAHKDRKKAVKRGEFKHKKDWRKDVDEGWGMNAYSTVAGSEPIAKHVPEDNVDPGYIDQENSMTSSSLKSLYKQAVRLRDLIKKMGDNTTLEPWQQEKIAKASDYVNSVFRSIDDEYGLDSLEEKIKGTDGKACWKGYRYAGTEKGKDKCVKVGEELDEEEKKGLWANIHARRKKGLPPRKPGEKGAPTKKSWDTAVAASKKKKAVGEDNLEEYETHTYTDSQGRKWRVDDEGNKDLIYDPNDRFGSKSRYSAPKQPKVYYFYNVPDGSAMKAAELGLKRTKSGKWYSAAPIDAATAEFGNPRRWEPKAEEAMMPSSHFAGTPKNKLGPAAHLKGKMKRPARQGDLVGGSAEESYSKKKTLKKN